MDSSNYEIINAMYDELKKKQTVRLSILHEKRSYIAEINVYLNNLLNKDESDFQVFLPRKVEDVYHDIIEKRKQEKKILLDECDELEKLIRSDKNRMKQLKKFYLVFLCYT